MEPSVIFGGRHVKKDAGFSQRLETASKFIESVGLTESMRRACDSSLSHGREMAGKVLEEERIVAERYRQKDPVTGWAYTSSPSLAVAPLLDPPIEGGLTHCISQLLRITQSAIPSDVYQMI